MSICIVIICILPNTLLNRSPAGLNPKECRAMRQPRRRELYNAVRGFYDGDLAFSFTDLGVAEKSAIAKRLQGRIVILQSVFILQIL